MALIFSYLIGNDNIRRKIWILEQRLWEILQNWGKGVKSRRWSSYDKTGGNGDIWPIPTGKTIVLGEMEGAGCIRHIWMTTTDNNSNLRRLIIRMYWDVEETPSVQCPIGDFFGLGHAKANYFQSLPF